MAEWMDNDENGCVDTPAILKHLVPTKTGVNPPAMVVYKKGNSNWDSGFGSFAIRAPQEGWETRPNCSGTTGTDRCNDATLEEVFHVVSAQGYAEAFKKQFWIGTPFMAASEPNKINSTLATLLDAARGGIKRSPVVPSAGYPKKAWYTYSDTTCDFGCQAMEYFWMGVAAKTGAIKNRGTSITREFK